MNKAQIEFCTSKVEELYKNKKRMLEKKHCLLKERKLTIDEKWELFSASCSLPIKTKNSWALECLDFSAYENNAIYDTEALTPALESLRCEADDLIAKIILGDSKEALALLAEFEARVL